MAKIVLGMVASHGPLLGTPPELWTERVKADQMNPALAFRGKSYSFHELKSLRAHENFAPQIELQVRQQRYNACQNAINDLSALMHEARPDVAVLIGNDQMEILSDDNQPMFMIHCGETLSNVPFSDVQKQFLGPGVELAEPNHHSPEARTYAAHPEMALHLTRNLMAEEFDIATSVRLPERQPSRLTGLPHAFGFFFRRIMTDKPIPTVAIFINTFFPPNQPSAARCLRLGEAIARAITSWKRDLRVAILGSGGMSHFVVDDEFDRSFLEACAKRENSKLLSFPDEQYQSGTSELKNWLPVKSAMNVAGLTFNLLCYQPLYRSEAGTGSGMGFAYWR